MTRLTVQVNDESHRALKLLALMESKTLSQVVVDAIDWYLNSKGAYQYRITKNDLPDEGVAPD